MNVDNAELLEKYEQSLPDLSRNQNTAIARAFFKWLGDGELDADAVRRWIKTLEKDYADGTVRRSWGIIHRLFIVNDIEWPFRRGDAPVIREQEVYAPALAKYEIESMVKAVRAQGTPEQRAFLCLSTVWGTRRIEMEEMKPEFLNIKDNLIYIATAKHGRQRYHAIPEHILPYLRDYGFTRKYSVSVLSLMFDELKTMIKLPKDVGRWLGWHSIRRAAIKAAVGAGFTETEVHSFYRWKRSTTNMVLLYNASQEVGRREVTTEIGQGDRTLDSEMYLRHPFVQYWR